MQQGQVGIHMNKCAVSSCNYFFHKKCQEKTELPDNIQTEVQSPVFICGGHHCQGCSQPLRVDDNTLRCLKCVASYHEGCKDLSKI